MPTSLTVTSKISLQSPLRYLFMSEKKRKSKKAGRSEPRIFMFLKWSSWCKSKGLGPVLFNGSSRTDLSKDTAPWKETLGWCHCVTFLDMCMHTQQPGGCTWPSVGSGWGSSGDLDPDFPQGRPWGDLSWLFSMVVQGSTDDCTWAGRVRGAAAALLKLVLSGWCRTSRFTETRVSSLSRTTPSSTEHKSRQSSARYLRAECVHLSSQVDSLGQTYINFFFEFFF